MTFLYTLILLITTSVIICEAHDNYLVKYIIGGKVTDINHVPYMAAISHDGNYRCGAAIIDKFWLITAAHCIQELQSGYSIRIGSSFKNSGGKNYKIDKAIMYPSYEKRSYQDDKNYNDDIALIKLEKPIKIMIKQHPIPLSRFDNELQTRGKIQISGFGAISERGEASEVLRTAIVPIVEQDQCKKIYSDGLLSDRVFCAGYVETGGVDSCFGDSGGPAVFNGKLIGIVMGGDGCARPGYPGIYTKISPFYNWIIKTTGLSEKAQYS